MFTTSPELARTIHADRVEARHRAAARRAANASRRAGRTPGRRRIPTGAHPLAGFVADLPGYEPVPT